MSERFIQNADFGGRNEHKKNLMPILASYNNPLVEKLMQKRGMLQEGELPADALMRAVNGLVEAEKGFNQSPFEIDVFKQNILELLGKQQIVLGTPIITNAGREKRPTSACVVIPVDLRADLSKIQETITPYFEMAMGSGFDLSSVDDPVKLLKELNEITKVIEKKCERPVASMGMLRVDHPKILEFITAKRNEDFNDWRFDISVACSDEFMMALNNNDQVWPLKDNEGQVIKTVRAKEIFSQIVDSSHYCGEPGLLFMDRFDQDNPVPQIKYQTVAPCAEIAMAPGEVCQFSYINLAKIVREEGGQIVFDFEQLSYAAKQLVRVLDDSVEISAKNAVNDSNLILSKRRIGIGVCGAADLLIKLGLQYDSSSARDLMADIIAVINYFSKEASVDLAQSRGAFPLFEISRYKDKDWAMRKGQKPTEHVNMLMWEELWQKISSVGLRNSETTAMPPTGNSSRLVGASSSIEPRFDLLSGAFHQVSADGQLAMVKAAQEYIDGSISKTFNLPNETTITEIDNLLKKCYQAGLKGVTVFRDKCLNERAIIKT